MTPEEIFRASASSARTPETRLTGLSGFSMRPTTLEREPDGDELDASYPEADAGWFQARTRTTRPAGMKASPR